MWVPAFFIGSEQSGCRDAAILLASIHMASKRLSRLGKIMSGTDTDADEQIFQLDNRLERFVHFWVLVSRQFVRHRCLVRASALSYSTLLALIPLLAVLVSVTGLVNNHDEKFFNGLIENMVASITPSTTIKTNSAPLEMVLLDTNNVALSAATATNGLATTPMVAVDTQKGIARQIQSLVANTSSGALGVTGMIFLIFTAISLLRGIEETFNDIWGVTRGRSWRMQILLYWTIPTLGAILLTTALGLANGARLQHTRDLLDAAPHFSFISEHFLPVVIVSLALMMFYKLTPNTKVETRAALFGGLFAGTAWHIYNQLGFLLVSKTAAGIYGSLALLVLFMGGLYIVWLILLFGAQIAYAYQNRAAYLQDRLADNVNQRGREFVALRIMTCLGQRFQNALRPATVPQLAAELEIPSRLTQSVLRTLAHSRLVTEIAGADAAFMPARPLADITAYDILLAMRRGNGQELPERKQPQLAEIYGEFARIEEAERSAASGVSLAVLAQRVPLNLVLPEKSLPPEKILQPVFAEKIEEVIAVESKPDLATKETTTSMVEKISKRSGAASPDVR